MRCNNCGAEVDNGTVNCPYCGCSVEGDGKSVTIYSAGDEDNRTEEEKRHEEVVDENSFAGNDYNQPRKDLGLKWASFLGYFAFWFGALINVVNASIAFRGEHYSVNGMSAELVYSVFEGLKYADKYYGIALLLAAVLCVVAAMAIIKFKTVAITLVPVISLYSAVISIVYCFLATIILERGVFTAKDAVMVLVCIVMFFVNRVYFNNRRHIFVN